MPDLKKLNDCTHTCMGTISYNFDVCCFRYIHFTYNIGRGSRETVCRSGQLHEMEEIKKSEPVECLIQ